MQSSISSKVHGQKTQMQFKDSRRRTEFLNTPLVLKNSKSTSPVSLSIMKNKTFKSQKDPPIHKIKKVAILGDVDNESNHSR